MPYVIRQGDDEFCLHKADTDEKMGCHPTREAAQAQMAALYANEKASGQATLIIVDKTGDEPVFESPPETVGVELKAADIETPPPPPPEPEPEPEPDDDKSWMDAAVSAAVPVEMGEDDPAFWEPPTVTPVTVKAAASTPLDADSGTVVSHTWDVAEGVTHTTGNFGVDKPRWEFIPDAFDKAKGWLLKHRPRLQTDFKVVDNHWFAIHSNNFKDRDDEIFPEQAIRQYVDRVDAGLVPPPDLMVWHIGQLVKVGKADMVGYHDHFTLSAGTFDLTPQGQKARDYYAKNAHKTRLSHGFTFPTDSFDGKHYHTFNTFEISLLPRGVEANLFTSLEGVKAMALKDSQIKYLEDVFGKEWVAEKLADLTERGKALEALGVEYKDFTTVTPAAPVESFGDGVKALISDLIEDNSVAVQAATEAVKEVKALKLKVAALENEIAGRPRKASEAAETELTPENITARMQEMETEIRRQAVVKDMFWGTDVEKVGV